MHYRCWDDATGEWVDPDEQLCYTRPSASSGGCRSLLFLDSPYSCEAGQSCRDYGVTVSSTDKKNSQEINSRSS